MNTAKKIESEKKKTRERKKIKKTEKRNNKNTYTHTPKFNTRNLVQNKKFKIKKHAIISIGSF